MNALANFFPLHYNSYPKSFKGTMPRDFRLSGKFATVINNTSKFDAGVVDTSGNFAAGVVDICGAP
jgi:hypothetical protein